MLSPEVLNEEKIPPKKSQKQKSPYFQKDTSTIPQKRVSTFFELPEPTIQYKTIDTEFYKALGGKRKKKITTMTLEEMREKIRDR